MSIRALPHTPRLAHTPEALGIGPIADIPAPLRGRLLLTISEVAQLVPLHEDTIRKLCDGEWARRGMVVRADEVRKPMVSLQGLVAWSIGAESERDARVTLQGRVAELEREVRLLRERLDAAARAAESAARIAGGAYATGREG